MTVLAVILGILAIICALLGTFLFGITGMIIAGVLGAVALGLGIYLKIKTRKGGGAILCGVIAIALAISVNNTMANTFGDLHQKALQYKPDGLWAQASVDTGHGIMGVLSSFPMEEDAMNAMLQEMNELNELTVNNE